MEAHVPIRMRKRHPAAFTLVEILVAVACLLILGGAMAAMLRSGVAMWREARARRVTYDRAQTLFGLLTEDLSAIQVPQFVVDRNSVNYTLPVELVVQCGYDAQSRLQGLSFPRSVSQTEQMLGLSTGGLVQVTYTQEPRTDGTLALYRSVVPLDSDGSSAGEPVMITDDLLYFGLRFWMPSTERWDYPADDPQGRGPSDVWDSTRGIPDLSTFRYYKEQESLLDPTDDVYPERIRVVAVIEPRNHTAILAKLQNDLSAEATGWAHLDTTLGFPLDASQWPYLGPGAAPSAYAEQQDSCQYVKIGSEWLHYSAIDGQSILVDQRGARGTQPQAHPAGSLVHVGKQFVFTFLIPSRRTESDLVADCQ